MDVLIGSRDHDHVTIHVRQAADARGDGWLICDLDIRAGAWSGSFEAWLCILDFPNLRLQLESLHETLDGTATFETLERQLEMHFTIDSRGHVAVTCTANDRAGDGNVLRFALQTDQSYLPQIITQLQKVESAYRKA